MCFFDVFLCLGCGLFLFFDLTLKKTIKIKTKSQFYHNGGHCKIIENKRTSKQIQLLPKGVFWGEIGENHISSNNSSKTPAPL